MHELQHYTVGGTVHVDALYVFRQADKDLLDLCRAGEYAFILSSRQVGKSSLMLRTAKQLAEEGIECVKLTLEEVGKVTTTAEQFYYGILHEIQKELQFLTKPHVWWQAHGHLSLAQRFSKFFGEVLLREVEAPIVVFIDEIDTTLNLPYSDDFFAAIRGLYNARADRPEYKRLSFVLIGVATPNDLIKDYTRTPFNIGKRVEVTDFTFEEARPLAQGFDLPNTHAQQVLQWILKWTKGHPYLTQRFCRAIAEDGRHKWSEIEIDAMAESLFMGRMSREDSNLDFVQRRLTHEGPYRLQLMQTYKDVRLGWRPVTDEEKSPVKSELKLTGIVQRENGNLAVRNPIYKEVFNKKWIDEHWPQFFNPTVVRNLKIALGVALAAVFVLLASTLWQTARREALAKENAQNAVRLAEQERLAAEQARQGEVIANSLKVRADSLRQVAVDINDELILQRRRAEDEARAATEARTIADLKRKEAEAQRKVIERLNQINLGRLLATQAPLVPQDTLAVLLARQAYLFNKRNDATLNNEVYTALRKALNAPAFSKNVPAGGPVKLTGPRDWARAVTFSADRRTIAAGSADSAIWVWKLDAPFSEATERRAHLGSVRAVAFSPSNSVLASAGEDGAVKLWNLGNLKNDAPKLLEQNRSSVWSLTFDPTGELLAFGNEAGMIRIWDMKADSARGVQGHRALIKALAFSADGKQLASGGADSTVQVWELYERNHVRLSRTWHQPARVKCVAFSPDGKWLAAGGNDGSIWFWDLLQPERVIEPIHGHEDEVNALAFSPDCKMLATGSADKTVRLWQVLQRQINPIVLSDQVGHTEWVWSVIFSKDGNQVFSAASDKAVLIWVAKPELLAEMVCQKVRRNLSKNEWEQYVGSELPYECTCANLPPAKDQPCETWTAK